MSWLVGAIIVVVVVGGAALLVIAGVRAAGRVQEVTTVLKLLPLIALVLLAIWLIISGAPRAPDPGVTINSGPSPPPPG